MDPEGRGRLDAADGKVDAPIGNVDVLESVGAPVGADAVEDPPA